MCAAATRTGRRNIGPVRRNVSHSTYKSSSPSDGEDRLYAKSRSWLISGMLGCFPIYFRRSSGSDWQMPMRVRQVSTRNPLLRHGQAACLFEGLRYFYPLLPACLLRTTPESRAAAEPALNCCLPQPACRHRFPVAHCAAPRRFRLS